MNLQGMARTGPTAGSQPASASGGEAAASATQAGKPPVLKPDTARQAVRALSLPLGMLDTREDAELPDAGGNADRHTAAAGGKSSATGQAWAAGTPARQARQAALSRSITLSPRRGIDAGQDDISSEKAERRARRRHRMPDGDAGSDADLRDKPLSSSADSSSHSLSDFEDVSLGMPGQAGNQASWSPQQDRGQARSAKQHKQHKQRLHYALSGPRPASSWPATSPQAQARKETSGGKRAADGRDGPGGESPHAKSPKRQHGQSPGQSRSPERNVSNGDDNGGHVSSTEEASFEAWQPGSPRKGRVQSMLLLPSNQRRNSAGPAMQPASIATTASSTSTSTSTSTSSTSSRADSTHPLGSAPASPRRARTGASHGRDRTYAISSQPRPLSPRLLTKGAGKALPDERVNRADAGDQPSADLMAGAANVLALQEGAAPWDASDVELAEISLAFLAQAGSSSLHEANGEPDAHAPPLTIRPDVLDELESLLAEAEKGLAQGNVANDSVNNS